MPSMRPPAGSSCWAPAPGRMSSGARRRSARRTRTGRPSRGARRGAPRGSNSRRASPGSSSSSPTRVPGSRRRTARRSSSPSIPPSRPDAAPGWVSPSSRARCTTWAASCGWTRRARAERPSKCSSLLCPPMVTFAPPLHNVERGPGGEDASRLGGGRRARAAPVPRPAARRRRLQRRGRGRRDQGPRARPSRALRPDPVRRAHAGHGRAVLPARLQARRRCRPRHHDERLWGRGSCPRRHEGGCLRLPPQAVPARRGGTHAPQGGRTGGTWPHHRASPRAGRPFVAVNCAAIPETLLESELFGYVKGAFTGAAGDRPGLFEQADGGTLLLDEIGELPLPLQAKLLRVLQESEIRRVGDRRTRRVDVRLLAATAKDLAGEAAAGRFRVDLFDRLNVVAIHLPPLAERREDIAPLARHFAVQVGRRLGRPLAVSDEGLAWLVAERWPGNARELEHAIERAAVLSDKEILEPDDFGPHPPSPSPQRGEGERGGEGTLRDAVEVAERQAITAALGAAGGNRRDAARRLGVSLRTLFYKMDRYGLD